MVSALPLSYRDIEELLLDPSRGSRPCCGCARASASPARGPSSSRTGCSGSASDFQRLTKRKSGIVQTRSTTHSGVCDKPPTFGFDAYRERYVDMLEAGIVDPAKVVRVALQDAASVADLLITTEAMIADRPGKDAPAMGGGMGGMGGMDY